MTVLVFIALAGVASPPATVVEQLLDLARVGDQAGFAKVAPNLQWEVVEGLKFDATFDDVSLFAKGCDSFRFEEPRPAETDGSMKVRAAATCEDSEPVRLTFDFTVRDNTVTNYFIKKGD